MHEEYVNKWDNWFGMIWIDLWYVLSCVKRNCVCRQYCICKRLENWFLGMFTNWRKLNFWWCKNDFNLYRITKLNHLNWIHSHTMARIWFWAIFVHFLHCYDIYFECLFSVRSILLGFLWYWDERMKCLVDFTFV